MKPFESLVALKPYDPRPRWRRLLDTVRYFILWPARPKPPHNMLRAQIPVRNFMTPTEVYYYRQKALYEAVVAGPNPVATNVVKR